MLFMRCVSGTRVVVPDIDGPEKAVGPLKFRSYGAHCDAYPSAYLTAACAIGVTREEVDEFLKRLDKSMAQFQKKRRGRKEGNEGVAEGEGQGDAGETVTST